MLFFSLLLSLFTATHASSTPDIICLADLLMNGAMEKSETNSDRPAAVARALRSIAKTETIKSTRNYFIPKKETGTVIEVSNRSDIDTHAHVSFLVPRTQSIWFQLERHEQRRLLGILATYISYLNRNALKHDPEESRLQQSEAAVRHMWWAPVHLSAELLLFGGRRPVEEGLTGQHFSTGMVALLKRLGVPVTHVRAVRPASAATFIHSLWVDDALWLLVDGRRNKRYVVPATPHTGINKLVEKALVGKSKTTENILEAAVQVADEAYTQGLNDYKSQTKGMFPGDRLYFVDIW